MRTLPALPPEVPAGKIPQWDLADLAHRRCPACDSDDTEVICRRPDRLIVSRCRICGLAYVGDVPTTMQLKEFYLQYSSYKSFQAPSTIRRLMRGFSYNPHLNILESTGGVRGKRICEIGCSYGQFLELCRYRGATVFGVEWDPMASVYLSQIGIETDAQIPSGANWDVVCAFQLLEHLEDPRQFLESVRAALAHDGRVLLAMPNGGEIARVGPTWLGFRVDLEHLNYFSVSALSPLLEKCGLILENYWEYGQPFISRGPVGYTRSITERFAALFNSGYSPRFSEGKYVLTVLARRT